MARVPNATCTACGCLCDDIVLVVENHRIAAAKNACELGERWFLNGPSDDRPACRMDGQPAPLEQGYARAAEILTDAGHVLVFGLTQCTCQTQRLAVSIADRLGATIDVSGGAAAPTRAVQTVGQVTATLGEVAQRSDLVIYWRCDPVTSHPRHLERYSLMPHGTFVPQGRRDRTCVVIDSTRTATAELADVFIELPPEADRQAFGTLQALARNKESDADRAATQTNVALADWRQLYEQMAAARYGVVFFGDRLSDRPADACQALFSLVRDVNRHTRFVCLPLGRTGNAAGAEQVLTWRTGYPSAVSFRSGHPEYDPDRHTAAAVLDRGDADAALVVGDDSPEALPPAAQDHLARIPTVTLGHGRTAPATKKGGRSVDFRVATYGVHTGGAVFRVDGVPLPLRPALGSRLPAAEAVLSHVERLIVERHGR